MLALTDEFWQDARVRVGSEPQVQISDGLVMTQTVSEQLRQSVSAVVSSHRVGCPTQTTRLKRKA